ncbi:hypothetical protein BX666DRAFT_498332 [Dichotomocladium elegans]|nr:hypothetical protein BX666DRAFT_498332 [Dichotomocladium elegans]
MSNSATVSTAIPGQHHSDPFFDWQKKRQHRYTDTCLFYPSAFTSAKRRSEGWVRRYSTSSIESGMASRNSSHTGLNSLHRRTLSLGTLSPTVQQRQDQLPALYDLITSPQQEITSQGSKDHRHKYHPSATEADLIALTTTTTTTVITCKYRILILTPSQFLLFYSPFLLLHIIFNPFYFSYLSLSFYIYYCCSSSSSRWVCPNQSVSSRLFVLSSIAIQRYFDGNTNIR